MRQLVPWALVLALSGFPTVALALDLDFQVQTVDATTASVKVVINHGFGCIGAPCREERVTLWVTPCPPGQPCMNGLYTYTELAAYTATEMTLNLLNGETYTFSGTFWDHGSSGGQCSWNCEHSEYLPAVEFYVPMAPVWDIQPVSSSIDTVWVDARFSDVDCAPNASCSYEYSRYAIWPCPLAVLGNNPNSECANGALSYRLSSYNSSPPLVRLALQAGVKYTFAGHMTRTAYCSYNSNPCGKVCCDLLAHATIREYTPAPVAVAPVTWGRVKSMYRD